MKVALSVFGRLHAFYLADQLYRRGALDRLYTTYPRFEVAKYGIPPSKVVSHPGVEAAFRAYQLLPAPLKGQERLLLQFPDLHDRLVARRLAPSMDIFHGWSQHSERSLLRAQHFGSLATLQRGSSHIQFQRGILQEEYELWGVRGELPHRNVVEREMREYAIASYVFVPSDFARATFLQCGVSAEKVVKVPLGVSLDQFYGTPKSHSVFRVIYVGTMVLRKGVHYLLQAFAALDLPRSELWLVGKMMPEMEPFLRRYGSHVRYWGKVRQAALREYYNQCSVFVLPSIEDGFGAVLTQAMACSLPVLSTTNTGGAEVITDGREGFILAIRDVDAIKERLLFLYEHRDVCAEMGRLARSRATATLSWNDYGDRMFSVFEALLRGRGGNATASVASSPQFGGL